MVGIPPNTTFAQYTIVSKLGEGGMGVVYRARDTKLGRDVAIKVLPTSLSENAQVLCDSARPVGGTWSKDGIIIFGPDYDTTILQVSAKGDEPTPLKTEEPVHSRYPYFLPDGRHFIFPRGQTGLWVGSLDSPEIKQSSENRMRRRRP